jgi:SRSO17 transposase
VASGVGHARPDEQRLALPRRPVSADAGYGDATEFRLGLEERDYKYVVAVKETTSAYPEHAQPTLGTSSGRGRPPSPETATTRPAFVNWLWLLGARTASR